MAARACAPGDAPLRAALTSVLAAELARVDAQLAQVGAQEAGAEALHIDVECVLSSATGREIMHIAFASPPPFLYDPPSVAAVQAQGAATPSAPQPECVPGEQRSER